MRLKELRQDSGKYQKDIAAYLGIDRTTYVKYENGTSEPPIATLIRLAELFDCTVDYLLEVTDQRRPESINLSRETQDVLKKYSRLNEEGQKQFFVFLDLLSSNPQFQKDAVTA